MGTPVAKDGWYFPSAMQRPGLSVSALSGIGGGKSQVVGGAAATPGIQGNTYYPVNPLGPHSGPTAAQFPNGQLPSGQPATPGTTSAPGLSSGLTSIVDALHNRKGGQGNHYGWGSTAITSLPQPWQDRITQRWGMYGGGQPMPSTLGDYRTAMRSFRWPGMG